MIRTLGLVLIVCGIAQAQAGRGEQVFAMTCSSGYCHGGRGVGAGAPRLAARGFDQTFIRNTITNGVAGTSMPSFSKSLSRADLNAVVVYLAALNGATPETAQAAAPVKLTPEASRGQALFSESLKSFGRCSTCHLVGGFGIAVAPPIHDVPLNVAALKALQTPRVVTATLGGDSMPALVVAKKTATVTFYDLTSAPPVLRTVAPSEYSSRDESTWRHASVTGAYSDADMTAVLAYLRVAK